jgi:hypothetical protein
LLASGNDNGAMTNAHRNSQPPQKLVGMLGLNAVEVK